MDLMVPLVPRAARHGVVPRADVASCCLTRATRAQDENKVEALDGVEELTGLTHLSAGGNQATSLAPLKALQSLRELSLPGNAVEAWDEVKHLAEHRELRVIDLSGACRAR